MRTAKIGPRQTVICSRHGLNVPVSECRECPDCFSIVPYTKVLCKRGIKKTDPLIKRSYGKRQTKKKL